MMCYRILELLGIITYLILDPFPDDSGHFISIEINNWLINLDFFEGLGKSSSSESDLRKHPNKDMDGV
jgi:hypothetical protein